MHNVFSLEQPSRAPQLIVQLVAYGNVLNIGYVESREQALYELHRLNRSGRLDELVGLPDEDKFLVLNVLPPLGVDRASLDHEVEILMCAVKDGTDEYDAPLYRWVDDIDVLPDAVREVLRL